jgi:proline iminopeptidase
MSPDVSPSSGSARAVRNPRMRMRLALAAALLAASACDTMSPTEPGNLVPLTVAEDASLPALALNGSRFHVQTFGDPANPVIVFLHGGPGSDYRGLLRLTGRYQGYSLGDEYFLVFWDQRGSGLSQRHGREQLTLAQYTSDLDAMVNHFSPNRPVLLVGESWGGMFATKYINEFPERVAGAVLIEPGPLDGATAERLEDDMFDLDFRAEWLNDWAWNTQFFSADDHARMDFERMLGSKHSQPRFHQSTTDPSPAWRMGAAANRYIIEDGQDASGEYDFDFTTDLAAFTTPVRFIAGARSEVLGPSLQQEQVLEYPAASLVVVAGAGHDVAWVKAAEVVAHIRVYLDELKGGN